MPGLSRGVFYVTAVVDRLLGERGACWTGTQRELKSAMSASIGAQCSPHIGIRMCGAGRVVAFARAHVRAWARPIKPQRPKGESKTSPRIWLTRLGEHG